MLFRLVVFWLFVVACKKPAIIFAFSPQSVIKHAQLPDKTFANSGKKGEAGRNQPHSIFVVTPRYRCHTARPASSASAISSLSRLPVPRTTALVLFASLLFAILLARGRRIFYPGSSPDLAFADIPAPPGDIGGCPFVGNCKYVLLFVVLRQYFPQNVDSERKLEELFSSISRFQHLSLLCHSCLLDLVVPLLLTDFLLRTSRRLGSPKIWRFFGFGRTIAVVSGSSAVKKFLGQEFKKDSGVSQITEFGSSIEFLGRESLSYMDRDAAKYHSLRRLVGQAMTPESVAKGIPALQAASEIAAESILSVVGSPKMEEACTNLTLDVAWRQIVGLDMKDDDEVEEFRKAADLWINSIFNPLYNTITFPDFIIKRVKPYKAKQYLTSLIERKIDDLEQNGPDRSTLSSMVFAVDEEDQSKQLTRQQVIDNVLLLILAGSETSAGVLTNAFFLLGSHPEVWNKLVSEQDELVKKQGSTITTDQLDKDCPYLDAVVKETMRILPPPGGFRTVDNTLVIDGVQIRKGWWGMFSIPLTHEQDPVTWKEDGSHMDVHLGFQPERWLDESSRPMTEFMPWGAGHRFCLGHTLATAEMKVFLAVMARRMKSFELVGDVDKVKWKEVIITTPKDGVEIAPVAL